MTTNIMDVWSFNLQRHLKTFDDRLDDYPILAIDTEFPGFFKKTPRFCEDERRYIDLKYNVDCMNIIQLGLTLSDEDGNIGGVWEFNFGFCLKNDIYSASSIDFLKKSGIDFERLKSDGINRYTFSRLFTCVLSKHQGLKWVTFHGLYDFAHLTKLLIQKPLPDTVLDFNQLLGRIFGYIVDLKYMAISCEGLLNGNLGLEKMATILEIERTGHAHNAGSDSLLTSLVFTEVKEMYEVEESDYVGYLYGIHSRIWRSQQGQVMSSVCYDQLSLRSMLFVHPLLPPVVCGFHAMLLVNMMNRDPLIL